MDIQLVLIVILVILTINLVIVGFYVFLILRDLRETIKKTNSVLDDAKIITKTVSNPLGSITTLATYLIKSYKSTKAVNSLVDFKGRKGE